MNKNCGLINDLIPLYVDDICSEESKMMVEEHIATCESCRDELKKMKSNLTLPLNVNGSDVKGFKKFVKKKIWIKTIAIVAVLVILLVVANLAVTLRFSEIWPKVDAEGVEELLEVVNLDGDLYLHQMDLFGLGEVIVISTDSELDQGIVRFYLGEQGLNTLDPFGKVRMWRMNEKYAKIPGDAEEVKITKVTYCHKNGEEVATLWETGKEVPTFMAGTEK